MDSLDSNPLNVQSGPEFLFLYGVFSIGALVLLSVLRRRYGAYLDARSIPSGVAALRVGQVPSQDQYYALAFLQRGVQGVAETLIAMAHACGAIKPVPGVAKHFLYTAEATVPEHPLLRQFLDQVKPKEGSDIEAATLKAESLAVARAHQSTLTNELAASGLIRSEAHRGSIYRLVWWIGFVIIAFGLVRLVRAIAMGHRFLFLAIEIVLVGIGVYLVAKKSDEAPLKDRYLDWLRDTTMGLRLNVSTNWDTTPQAVGLGVALDGASILGTAAVAAGLVYAFHPNYDLFMAQAHAKTPFQQPQQTSSSHHDTGSSVDISGSWSGSDSGGGGSDSGGGGESGGGGGDGGGGGGCGGGGGGCGGGGGGGGCGGGGGGCGGGG